MYLIKILDGTCCWNTIFFNLIQYKKYMNTFMDKTDHFRKFHDVGLFNLLLTRILTFSTGAMAIKNIKLLPN